MVFEAEKITVKDDVYHKVKMACYFAAHTSQDIN